jgi:hypothetical protein
MSRVLPRARLEKMGRNRRLRFFMLYVAGCASVATASGYAGYSAALPMRVPQAGQIVLGLLMVFVVPGTSLVCAALPEPRSWVEGLLASVGISVCVATCLAVLLAATPVGFSRQLLGELLGGIAIVLSLAGLHPSRLHAVERLRAPRTRELQAWMDKHVVAPQRQSKRLNNSGTRQQNGKSQTRRSVVTLKFSFGSKTGGPRA